MILHLENVLFPRAFSPLSLTWSVFIISSLRGLSVEHTVYGVKMTNEFQKKLGQTENLPLHVLSI